MFDSNASIFLEEMELCSARVLIFSATIANPLPDSPALAASIEALREIKLVSLDMEVIISNSEFILADKLVKLLILAFIFSNDVNDSLRVHSILLAWLTPFSTEDVESFTVECRFSKFKFTLSIPLENSCSIFKFSSKDNKFSFILLLTRSEE